jgi:hypothetical protein
MEAPEGNSTATPALVGFAQTDSSGRYRIENLEPRRYYILAGILEAPSYYPGTADRAQATAISVVAGAVMDSLGFSLSAANQSGIIQVVVQHAKTAAPIANAQVTLRRQGDPVANSIETTTDANGLVTVGGLTVGQYRVDVQREGFVGQRGARGQSSPGLSASTTIRADAPESRIAFSLTTAATIEGRLLNASGQPVPYARGSLAQMGYRNGRSGLLPGGSTAVQTDAQGRFSFNVGSGEYYVRIEMRNSSYGETIVYYPGVTDVS